MRSGRRGLARASAQPEIDRSELAARAAALGVALSGAQFDALAHFQRLLAKWNAVHSLTAISASETLTHHMLDSLAVVPVIETLESGAATRALDVGSGGGLPGIPLAIACPQIGFTLLDAVQKKCAFLEQVRLELRLPNVAVVHARVERWQAQPFDLIVARAFSSLVELSRCTRHLLRAGGRWLAMKGPSFEREIAALPASVRCLDVLPLAIPGLGERRNLVVMCPA